MCYVNSRRESRVSQTRTRGAPVAGDDVHERGLAGAAGAHDGREAAAREAPAQPVQNVLHLYTRTVLVSRTRTLARRGERAARTRAVSTPLLGPEGTS